MSSPGRVSIDGHLNKNGKNVYVSKMLMLVSGSSYDARNDYLHLRREESLA